MFMVASSVVLTVVVLNYHHRTADIHEMPPWVSLSYQSTFTVPCLIFASSVARLNPFSYNGCPGSCGWVDQAARSHAKQYY